MGLNVRRLLFAVFVVSISVWGPVAWSQQTPAIQIQRTLSWTAVPGTAADIAITPAGDVFAVGLDGKAWRWSANSRTWSPLSGQFAHITVGIGGRPWAVGTDGRVFRFNGIGWDPAGDTAVDIAGDAKSNLYLVRPNGALAKWNAQRNDWEVFSGEGAAVRVAVGPDGNPWTIAKNGAISRYDGTNWIAMEGLVRDIVFGARGALHAVTEDGTLQVWNETTRAWTEIPGVSDVAVVALGPRDRPWVATRAGTIFATDMFLPEPEIQTPPTAGAGATAPPGAAARAREPGAQAASLTSTDPIVFVDTERTAARLVIGADGSVFAFLTDGSLARWSNARRMFLPFPGSFVRVAVDPSGKPWGVNALGRIFRHDGNDWLQVNGVATDIGIGADGTVIVTAPGEILKRRTAAGLFETIPGNGQSVAVTPDGKPWTIRGDGSIFRCDVNPCLRLPRQGKSIAIGPDGSVFVTTPDNKLLRFDRAINDWREISVPSFNAAFVAVGPRGRPWIVASTARVLASAVFERDESRDVPQILATNQPTTGTGPTTTSTTTTDATGFVFSKNLPIKQFSVPYATVDDVGVGTDGTVVVKVDNGGGATKLANFNTRTETFSAFTPTPPNDINAAMTGPDGKLWAATTTTGRVIQQTSSSSYQNYTIAGVAAPTDIAVDSAGTVFVLASGDVYRKLSNETAFKKFANGSYTKIAIGQAGFPWVIDSDAAVSEYNGTTFVRRSNPGVLTATDVGGGKDGTIYICQAGTTATLRKLRKWNRSNQSFDETNRTCNFVSVAPEGRPWFLHNSVTGDLFKAR